MEKLAKRMLLLFATLALILCIFKITVLVRSEAQKKECVFNVYQGGGLIDVLCLRVKKCESFELDGIYYKWTDLYCSVDEWRGI